MIAGGRGPGGGWVGGFRVGDAGLTAGSRVDSHEIGGLCFLYARTGKYREQDLSLGIEPDAVLGSPEELPNWYRNAGFDQ